jgi:hypothetical protein
MNTPEAATYARPYSKDLKGNLFMKSWDLPKKEGDRQESTYPGGDQGAAGGSRAGSGFASVKKVKGRSPSEGLRPLAWKIKQGSGNA